MFCVEFEYFKGPLDQLLDLCVKHKLEISIVNVEIIITHFIKWINNNNTNLEIASEYLVIAARLIEIKTKLILKEELDKEEEENLEEFIHLLIEYKSYQNYAKLLSKLSINSSGYISKEKMDINKVESKYSIKHKKNQRKLINIYKQVLKNIDIENRKKEFKNVNLVQVSLSETILDIQNKLLIQKQIFLKKIKFKSKEHLIVYFLALLELNNTQKIKLEEQGEDLIVYGY